MGPYQITLADSRADSAIRNIAGVCPLSPEYAELVNRVTRKLLRRGAWFGTEVLMKLCVYGEDVVWPRYVASVLGARFCCYGNIGIKNNWYAILGPYSGWNGGWVGGYGSGHLDIEMYDNGTACCFNQITGNAGKFLRYQIVKNTDIDKQITFFGTQYGGQPLQELDSTGNWINGLTIAATVPIAQTTTLVTRLDSVTRQETQGMAYLYQYDGNTGDLIMLAQYEPNETNPRYRRSKIRNIGCIPHRTDDNGQKVWQMEAMVKLEFIPATADRDFLMISNMDALAYAIQAVKLDEQQDPQNAEVYWQKAISELNFESRMYSPGEQFVTRVNVLGSQRILTNPV